MLFGLCVDCNAIVNCLKIMAQRLIQTKNTAFLCSKGVNKADDIRSLNSLHFMERLSTDY